MTFAISSKLNHLFSSSISGILVFEFGLVQKHRVRVHGPGCYNRYKFGLKVLKNRHFVVRQRFQVTVVVFCCCQWSSALHKSFVATPNSSSIKMMCLKYRSR